MYAAVFVDAHRRSGTTWFTKDLDNYLLLGANPASPTAEGRHWPSACVSVLLLYGGEWATFWGLVSFAWRDVWSTGFVLFLNLSTAPSASVRGLWTQLTTNKLKYQPKRGHVAHGWNHGRQVVEGFVFRKAQEARSDKSDFCEQAENCQDEVVGVSSSWVDLFKTNPEKTFSWLLTAVKHTCQKGCPLLLNRESWKQNK